MQIPYSAAVDGTTTTLGPFPFAARGVTVVNATNKDATVTDDRGISNVVKAGTIVSFPPHPTHYLRCALSAAATAPASISVYVSDSEVPITSSGLALPSTGGSSLIRVTVLPAAPADGDTVILNLNALFPGVEWLCVYNASTLYWDVIGGPPITVTEDTQDTIAAPGIGTFVEPTHTCRITVPNLGDYLVTQEARVFTAVPGAAGQWVTETAFQINNGAVASNDTSYMQYTTADVRGDMHHEFARKVSLAAGDILKLVYSGNIGASPIQAKQLRALPYRIK